MILDPGKTSLSATLNAVLKALNLYAHDVIRIRIRIKDKEALQKKRENKVFKNLLNFKVKVFNIKGACFIFFYLFFLGCTWYQSNVFICLHSKSVYLPRSSVVELLTCLLFFIES